MDNKEYEYGATGPTYVLPIDPCDQGFVPEESRGPTYGGSTCGSSGRDPRDSLH